LRIAIEFEMEILGEVPGNPRYSFDQLPFPDTRITQVYANPADGLDRIAKTLDVVGAVDAVWLGDANGQGEDHCHLLAPALRRGYLRIHDHATVVHDYGGRTYDVEGDNFGAKLVSESPRDPKCLQ
jgi:hypothetical protein